MKKNNISYVPGLASEAIRILLLTFRGVVSAIVFMKAKLKHFKGGIIFHSRENLLRHVFLRLQLKAAWRWGDGGIQPRFGFFCLFVFFF